MSRDTVLGTLGLAGASIGGISLLVGIFFAISAIFMLLWNKCVINALTVAQKISFWDACGIVFLLSLVGKPSVFLFAPTTVRT